MLIRFGPPNNFHLPTPLLTLDDVTRDDAGTYRCQLSFDGAEIEGAFVDFELTVHCECRAVGSKSEVVLPTALHSQCTDNSKSTKAPSI